jgi:hypothetical protein
MPCYRERDGDPACPQVPGLVDCRVCIHLQQTAHFTRNVLVAYTCPQSSGGGVFCAMAAQNLKTACTQAGVALSRSVAGVTGNPSDTSQPNPNIPVTATLTGTMQTDPSNGAIRRQGCDIQLTNAANSPSLLCVTGTPAKCSGLVYGKCRLQSFGNDTPGACGYGPVKASTTGLSSSALASSEANIDMVNAACTTKEPLSIAAAADSRAHAEALAGLELASASVWGAVPASADVKAYARAFIVRHQKLLLELKWDDLTTTERTNARALYGAYPDTEHACGVPFKAPVSAACLDWAAQQGIGEQLGVCRRVLSSHVAAGFVNSEYPSCIALMSLPVWSTSSACVAELRPYIASMTEGLALRVVSQANASGTDTTKTAAALAAIDTWQTASRTFFPSNSDEAAAATSRLLAAFWRNIQATALTTPVAFPTGSADSSAQTNALLATMFDAELKASQHVLMAAFSDQVSLHSNILLAIVNDSLQPLVQKLDQLAPYYDFACRIRGCSTTDANEATSLYRLIGSLVDKTSLDEALGAPGAVRASWKSVFSQISAHHASLVASYRDATGRPDAGLQEVLSDSLDARTATFASLVSGANAHWLRYRASGLLEPHAVGQLRNGLEHERRIIIANELDNLRSGLMTNVATFAAARGTIANRVLDRIQSGDLVASVVAEIDALRFELVQASNDLDGLRRAHDRERTTFGSFMEAYLLNSQRPGWLPDFPVNMQQSFQTVRASDASYDGTVDAFTHPTAVAVHSSTHPSELWTKIVAPGDILAFRVEGQWAPTCALRANAFSGPTDSDILHAKTGPEGYQMVWAQDHAQASSYSTANEDFTTTTRSVSGCAGMTGSLPIAGGDPGTSSLSLQGSVQYCYTYTKGHKYNEVTSDSNTTTDRSSAAFAGGVRLAETPFPTMPAGALLLVETIGSGDARLIRDVNVVTASSSFVFDTNAEVFLVVNDLHCPEVDLSPLSVTIIQGQSAAAASKALALTMSQVLTDVTAKTRLFTDQGSVSATELEVIRNDAMDALRTGCGGCNLETYPQTVLSMFQTYVSHLVADVERQVRIADAERDVIRILRRLLELSQDLQSAEERVHAEQLFTYWDLANLSSGYLRTSSQLLFEWIYDRVIPMMTIRYPVQFAGARSAAAANLNALRTLDFMLPMDVFAQRAEDVASVVSAKLREGAAVSTNRTAPVVLKFSKPPLPGSPEELDDLFGADPDLNEWNKAKASRRDMVWQPVLNAHGVVVDYKLRDTPVFEIAPEDIYQDGKGGLLCQEAAPVINSMALYVLGNNSTDSRYAEWNNNARRRPAYPSPMVSFTHENEGMQFVMTNPEWNGMGVRILAGADQDVSEKFAAFALDEHAALGLSPFGTFTVDLAPLLRNPTNAAPGPLLTDAKAIYVVMRVEARGALGPLAGVPQCP